MRATLQSIACLSTKLVSHPTSLKDELWQSRTPESVISWLHEVERLNTPE